MTISYRGANNAAGESAGSVAASTVPIAITLPAGAVAGDRIFVIEVGSDNGFLGITASLPTGWTVVSDDEAGTGTQASGSGKRRIASMWRDYDGVWTMPTMSMTSVANNSHWIGAVALTSTGTYGFANPTYITATNLGYNTATTAWTWNHSAVTTTGGFLVIGSVFNDNVTSSAVALSQSGATFSGLTERCDGGNATGHIVAGKVHTAAITTGVFGAATLTMTQTLSAASQGEAVFIQQLEALAPISSLTDTFPGSTIDATKWTSPSGTPNVGSGTLNLPFVSSLPAQLTSLNTYSFVGSSVMAQAVTIGGSTNYFGVEDVINFGQALWAFPTSTTAQPYLSASLGTSRTHVNGTWYRVRESFGTIFWDYSSDGKTWLNYFSALTSSSPSLMDVNNLKVFFRGPASGSDAWDNFNSPPVSNQGNFFILF